jgi:hypothetical protein
MNLRAIIASIALSTAAALSPLEIEAQNARCSPTRPDAAMYLDIIDAKGRKMRNPIPLTDPDGDGIRTAGVTVPKNAYAVVLSGTHGVRFNPLDQNAGRYLTTHPDGSGVVLNKSLQEDGKSSVTINTQQTIGCSGTSNAKVILFDERTTPPPQNQQETAKGETLADSAIKKEIAGIAKGITRIEERLGTMDSTFQSQSKRNNTTPTDTTKKGQGNKDTSPQYAQHVAAGGVVYDGEKTTGPLPSYTPFNDAGRGAFGTVLGRNGEGTFRYTTEVETVHRGRSGNGAEGSKQISGIEIDFSRRINKFYAEGILGAFQTVEKARKTPDRDADAFSNGATVAIIGVNGGIAFADLNRELALYVSAQQNTNANVHPSMRTLVGGGARFSQEHPNGGAFRASIGYLRGGEQIPSITYTTIGGKVQVFVPLSEKGWGVYGRIDIKLLEGVQAVRGTGIYLGLGTSLGGKRK